LGNDGSWRIKSAALKGGATFGRNLRDCALGKNERLAMEDGGGRAEAGARLFAAGAPAWRSMVYRKLPGL
jgi:hypothetical protein